MRLRRGKGDVERQIVSGLELLEESLATPARVNVLSGKVCLVTRQRAFMVGGESFGVGARARDR